MKVLQIGTIDNSGGAASISWSIKNSLEKEGSEVYMFVRDKISNDGRVHTIPQRIHRYFHYLISNDLDMYFTDWITRTDEFKNADLVHFHNIHGWYFNIKTLQKISMLKPTLWTLHDMWAITPHCAYSFESSPDKGFYKCKSRSMYPRITWSNETYLKWRKKNVYKHSNFTIVTPSIWLKNKVQNSILGDKRIELIYNGIDETIFTPTDQRLARIELGLPTDKKIITFLSDGGSSNAIKGWQYVESLIKNSKEDELYICIGGNESKKDETYPNLIYIERINDKKNISKYFSASNVFLFPTLADNCPLVILEALSSGVPIVTFSTGGIPELVTHMENGYVAKYGDVEDLESGVKYVLDLGLDEIEKMKFNSREKVRRNFTESKMINEYKALYLQVISAFKKGYK